MHNSDYNKNKERRPAGYVYPDLVKKIARARVFLEELSTELSDTALAPTLGISRQAVDKHVEKARKEIEYNRNGGDAALITPRNKNLSDQPK